LCQLVQCGHFICFQAEADGLFLHNIK
jgi:hypothetical protein